MRRRRSDLFSHHQGQGYTIPQLPLRSSTSHDIKRNNEVSGCSEQFLQIAVAVCHWPNWVRLPTAISAFAEILHTGIKTLNLALANLTFSHLQSSKYHKLIKCRIRPALGEKRHLSERTHASLPPTHLIIESKVGVSQDGQICQGSQGFQVPLSPDQSRRPPCYLHLLPCLGLHALHTAGKSMNWLSANQSVGPLKGTSHLHQTPCSPTSTFTTFNCPYNTKTHFSQVSIVWSIAR